MSGEVPAPPGAIDLLDEHTVGPYLCGRGVFDSPEVTARALSGGVSNTVLLAEHEGQRVVVKQALGRLRVADDWFADPARAHGEAVALRLLGAITPGAVPAVLDDDPEHHALTIEAAPLGWDDWRNVLLTGKVDAWVAPWLGSLLRTWHAATVGSVPADLESKEIFRQLRIDPYLGVSARRRQDLAPALDRYAKELMTRRVCLVNGDFSPKNVLIGEPHSGWVIDLEVAHLGDPAFDVAFLLTHLVLKGVHVTGHEAELRGAADSFLATYGDGPGCADARHLYGVLGCLLLARVVGSSPAVYLLPDEATAIEAGASRLVVDPPETFEEVWQVIVSDR